MKVAVKALYAKVLGEVKKMGVFVDAFEGNGLAECALPPIEGAIACCVLHPCAMWQRIVVSRLLRPTLWQQEAHPQIR
jgi:hypothetical protein